MCSDDPNTVIIKTDAVNRISDLQLGSNGQGSVLVEAGVTFPQLAEWLHERGAALGYTLGEKTADSELAGTQTFLCSQLEHYHRYARSPRRRLNDIDGIVHSWCHRYGRSSFFSLRGLSGF